MGADENLGVVAFAEVTANWPCELFRRERELCVHTGLVAARILPVPTPLQVDGDESMENEGRAVVGQSLIAQARGDALRAEQSREQVSFREAKADPIAKDV